MFNSENIRRNGKFFMHLHKHVRVGQSILLFPCAAKIGLRNTLLYNRQDRSDSIVCRSTFIKNRCVMRGNHSSVIDSAGEKNKRRFSVSDRNDPRRTPTKSASAITKITATIRTGAGSSRDEADLFVV